MLPSTKRRRPSPCLPPVVRGFEGGRSIMESIEELFEHELKDILGGERSLLDALEQMADESTDREIKKTCVQHRKETQGQIKRLEKIFRILGEKPTAELLEFFNIGEGQKMERYGITAYESLIDMAEKVSRTDVAALLEETRAEVPAERKTLEPIGHEVDATDP